MGLESQILKDLHGRTVKNFTDILIMKSLRKESPLSGYELIMLFHEKFHLLLSSGTVYSKLYSMERDGLIKGEWNGRKRVYQLTEKGKETIDFILKSRNANLQLMREILS
jgi:DNA-binding PadR family transcriptional regulator